MMRRKKTRTEGKRMARRVSCEERGPNWLGGGQMSRRPNVNLHSRARPSPPLLCLPLAEPSGPRDGRAIQPEVAKRDQHTALYSVRRRRRRRRRRGIQCNSRPSYRARVSFSGNPRPSCCATRAHSSVYVTQCPPKTRARKGVHARGN